MHNPKYHFFKRALTLSSLMLSSAFADTRINLDNIDSNSFTTNVGSRGPVTTVVSGNSRIVTYNLSNLDLAEDGSANDSLRFSIRVAAKGGGTVSDFSVTGGDPWGVNGGTDGEIDLGEGLSFSLVSSSISLGNPGADVGLSFAGFTAVNSWFIGGDRARLTGATNDISNTDFGSLVRRVLPNSQTNFVDATDHFSVRSEGPAADGFYLGNLQLTFIASPLTSLNNVFDQITAHLNGSSSLTRGQIQNLTTTLRNNIETIGSSEAILERAISLVELHENVRGSIFSNGQFNREMFNNVNNALRQFSLDLQQGLITHGWTSQNLRRYPDTLENRPFLSANFFPGAVAPPTDPDEVYEVQINANVPRQFGFTHIFKYEAARRPTGAYLAPGSVARVTVPAALVNKGYNIRVNAHVHQLERLNFYRRMDFISKVYPITSTTTEVASPIGGGIYIEIPYGEEGGLQTIEFQNTVRSAFYSNTVARQTTLNEWLNEERNHPAPWTDFESDVYQMTLPRDWVYAWGVGNNNGDNPVEVMEEWSDVMRTVNRMFGYKEPRAKTTLYTIADTSIRANVNSPGYPQSNSVFNPSSASQNGRANHDFLNGPRFADFARLHELGHAEYFTKFPGEVESAVNLLYVFGHYYDLEVSIDEALGRSVGNASRRNWSRDQNAIHWMVTTEFRNQVDNMAQQQQGFQQRGYTEYVDIAYMFGLDSLGRFWHQDHVDFENGISRVNGRNNDQPFGRIQRLSLAAGINLDPLHHFWGSSASNFAVQRQFMEDNNLPLSRLIYDRLRHYQTVIPSTLQEFRTHRNIYRSHLSAAEGELYDELNGGSTSWGQEEHDAAFANMERIINFHFPNGRPKISTFPHTADFNDNFSEWGHQENDDAWDWRLHTGPTTSPAAGSNGSPDGSQYLLLEGHDSPNGDRAAFMDNLYDFSGLDSVEFTFDYHMRGSFIDSLSVDIHDGNQWLLDVFLLEGQQHSNANSPWSTATVDLSAFAGMEEVTIRLRGQKVQFSSADISIDNLVVSGTGAQEANNFDVIFSTDFGTSAISDVNAGNLDNVSTPGGTWSVNFDAVNVANISGNSDGSDFALLVDEAGQGGSARGTNATLTLASDATFDDTLTVQFDLAAARGGINKVITITGYGADDTTVAFQLDLPLHPIPYRLQGLTRLGFQNITPGISNFASATSAYNPNRLAAFTVTLEGNSLVYAVEGANSISTTLLNGQTTLSSIVWEITGSAGSNQGFWLDNVSVTSGFKPTGSSVISSVASSAASRVTSSVAPTATSALFNLWTDTAFDGAPVSFDRTENGNSDGDDYTNIEEYLFVLDPLVADSPPLNITSSPSGNNFVVEYLARDSESSHVRAAWSSDLLPGSWRYDGDGLTEALLETTDGIERRSVTVPIGEDPKFIRLEIETSEEQFVR